jgi:hypothetical protein
MIRLALARALRSLATKLDGMPTVSQEQHQRQQRLNVMGMNKYAKWTEEYIIALEAKLEAYAGEHTVERLRKEHGRFDTKQHRDKGYGVWNPKLYENDPQQEHRR